MDEQILRDYELELKSRSVRPNTLKNYLREVIVLDNYLKDKFGDSVLTTIPERIRIYFVDLASSREVPGKDGTKITRPALAPASRSKAIVSVHVFYAWAKSKQLITADMMHDIRMPKNIKQKPEYLNSEEVKTFLAAAKQDQTWKGVRNYALMATYIYTGLRLSELLDCNIGDLDWKETKINITAKGGLRDQADFSEFAVGRPLKEWLKIHPIKDNPVAPLFVNSQAVDSKNLISSRLTGRSVERIVKAIAKDAGFELVRVERIHPHSLRHTFGSMVANESKDPYAVQAALRHKNVATSQIYTHLEKSKATDVVRGLGKK
jgi:integrase/recombinase XerC